MSLVEIHVFAKIHNVHFGNYVEARKENLDKVKKIAAAGIKAGIITDSNNGEVGYYCFFENTKKGFTAPVFIQKEKFFTYMEVIQKVENGFSYIICGKKGQKLPKYFPKKNGTASFVFPYNEEFVTVVVYMQADTTMVDIRQHYLVREGFGVYVESENIWFGECFDFETNIDAPFEYFFDAVTIAKKNLINIKTIVYGG